MESPFIHPLAAVESTAVGSGTRIWQYVVVLPGARIGRDCNLCAHCLVEDQVEIGDRTVVKSGVQLWNGVRLGADVFVGPNVTFSNDHFPRAKAPPAQWAQTLVEDGASIGANATLLPGVRIGKRAMIGAGSVVTRDVPEGEVWFGNPARKRGLVSDWDARRAANAKDGLAIQNGPVAASGLVRDEGSYRSMSVNDCRLIDFQEIVDARGHLAVVHAKADLGYSIERVYHLYGVPPGGSRGGHAHRRLQACLIAVSGSFEVVVNDSVRQKRFTLNHPKQGLLIPPMIWRELAEFSAGAVCLVLASEPYDESEYVRGFNDFVAQKSI
jgi:UDP-2-acetamido-3-amino-2,3-dideoxy-glucuronate N-acetyltransferase